MDNLQSEHDKHVAELEAQLTEVVQAENFFETGSGRLWMRLATEEITRITRDITSEKYRKDPVGYNTALSDLLAYKKIMRKMQLAANPKRRQKIEEALPKENA